MFNNGYCSLGLSTILLFRTRENAIPKSAIGYVKLVKTSAKKKSLNLTNPKGAIEIWNSDFRSWNLAFLKKHGIHGCIHIKIKTKKRIKDMININLVYYSSKLEFVSISCIF